MEISEIRMIDIRDPDDLEILHDKVRGVLWVNVEGICVLRIQEYHGKVEITST